MGSPLALNAALRARLTAHLSAHIRHVIDQSVIDQRSLKPAAVALTLLPDARGEASFLLTRRAGSLSHHGGQFALPGGRLDPGETAEQAARRELSEELGVVLDAEHVLGVLDDFATRSGFVITPVVLWAAGVHTLVPDPGEVAIVYRVPLRNLYRPEVPVLEMAPEGEGQLLSLPLLGTHIHSPTAAIVFQMREVAFEGRATRVHHYDQPRFAWK